MTKILSNILLLLYSSLGSLSLPHLLPPFLGHLSPLLLFTTFLGSAHHLLLLLPVLSIFALLNLGRDPLSVLCVVFMAQILFQRLVSHHLN